MYASKKAKITCCSELRKWSPKTTFSGGVSCWHLPTSQRPRRSKPAAAKAAPGAASAAVSHRAAKSTGAVGRVLQSCDTERSLDESSTSTHPRVFESSADVAANSVLKCRKCSPRPGSRQLLSKNRRNLTSFLKQMWSRIRLIQI